MRKLLRAGVLRVRDDVRRVALGPPWHRLLQEPAGDLHVHVARNQEPHDRSVRDEASRSGLGNRRHTDARDTQQQERTKRSSHESTQFLQSTENSACYPTKSPHRSRIDWRCLAQPTFLPAVGQERAALACKTTTYVCDVRAVCTAPVPCG